jgi:cell division protein FtsL
MMKKYLLLYLIVLTIPIFMGLKVWQANRYTALKQETKRLEANQSDWVESNKRLVAGISVLSAPKRIINIARKELGMIKIKPESVLQIKITEGNE